MIYLDHAATTPLRREAREAMLPFLDGRFGNPSGLYEVGRDAQQAVDEARRAVAGRLGARPAEVIFTSGGTESINAALLGIAYAMRRAGAGDHVITTAIEHHAGLHTAQALEELGFDVTYLGCDGHGRVDPAEFEAALRQETVLASVMLANNEVGTIQPVREIGEAIARYAAKQGHRVLLHSDAVQAPGWVGLDVNELGVDALSLSGHKFGGPKGTGVLFLRRGTPFRPLIQGGGQEMQKRAGTENVAGIVGTAAALRVASSGIPERADRVRRLREQLREGVQARIPGAQVNGCRVNCLPNNLNVSFEGVESDVLVAALDRQGIAASSGSACSNSTWEPSHVLMAMGVPIRRAVGSVRFSLGEGTTAEEIERVLEVLPAEVARATTTGTAV
ncbi:MAG: cysteine desulfurase [Dehalococcoidia bacterium]|nr:cysteine desulfurase [Chloroflexi bacterium CFX7]MCK6564086.1 cysteine desulfurase [Dehalococcoidia bacterium]NUQ55325.1 cysteine desulfurase [Dehalococcoidia bacterium]